MAGRKLFTNNTPHALHVTLLVRASYDPRNSAGTKEFHLGPQESQWQEYGNHIDIYLNGITVVAMSGETEAARKEVVIVRGSPLDDVLNMRNAVTFSLHNGHVTLDTRQV